MVPNLAGTSKIDKETCSARSQLALYIYSEDSYVDIPPRVVMQTRRKPIFVYFFEQFLGLDGPYLALLGPLLASPASGLTPSTRGIPDSIQPRQIFDKICRDLQINGIWNFLPPKFALNGLELAIKPSDSKFCYSNITGVSNRAWGPFL